MSVNQALACSVVGRLRAGGVRTFCICPGGRNAPLLEALEALPEDACEVLSFFDERSAGFFALGRARRDDRPVAVITTSGTAAAELLPAVVEAYYSAVPLVAVTADRPRRYRGSGAPQAIEQVGLFGVYAPLAVDLEHPDEVERMWAFTTPSHVNVCFSEPLLAGWDPAAARASLLAPAEAGEPREPHPRSPEAAAAGARDLAAFLDSVRQPLVMVGALQDEADRDEVAAFCAALGVAAVAEASSGIRATLGATGLRSGDAAIEQGVRRGLFDGVLRLGDVPSSRVWRDLDLSLALPVLSISRKRWPGLSRGAHVQVPARDRLGLDARVACDWRDRPARRGGGAGAALDGLLAWDRRLAAATDRLLAALPSSEPAMIRRLSESIPQESFVYLGNSLPIREWNRFATCDDRRFRIGENRGANGIDGQVSTFLGWATPDVENWAVLGDLTTLYDLSSPWALRHLDALRLRLVVVNNGGGRIFKTMFRNERFQNLHAVGFEAWAAMWGLEYRQGLDDPATGPAALIELRPDQRQTDEVWSGLAAEGRR